MNTENFDDLVAIVRRLRKDCPWDKEQTNDSIKAATIEEAFEVVESIDEKDFEHLKEELGDLLLHIIFHTIIVEESGTFYLNDVIETISKKLIRRHPHVFGEVEVNNSEDVKRNWEKIKLTEGRKSAIQGVPKNLPALLRAHRLQDKASKVGFDWDNKDDVWAKVLEEINELKDVEKESDSEKIEKEFGDVLFALVNYGRFIGVNPENALRLTNEKFIKRFSYIEAKLTEFGKKITDSNIDEMNLYWEESKKFD